MSNFIKSADVQKLERVRIRIAEDKKREYFKHARVYKDLNLITSPEDFDKNKPIFYFVFGKQFGISLREAVDRFTGAFYYQSKSVRY